MISTRSLVYRHAGGPELRFDDISVAQGGIALLRGVSGSGKSTWLALAAGLLTPAEGEISVAGQSVGQLGQAAGDAWRAATIGFLPQRLHLSPSLNVRENLAMAQWAAGRREDKERIYSALLALGVPELMERKPAQLSGGQAQRVALARAMLLKPQVILADEPTASLDDQSAAVALQLLEVAARHESATLVIATHDRRVPAFFEHKKGLQTLCMKRREL